MESYYGYSVGVFVNGGNTTMSPSSFSFMLADSIYTSFPTLRLSFSDPTGLFLEFGSFTQGMPLNVKFGMDKVDGLLDVDFVSARRDVVRMMEGSSALGAVIDLRALHKSFLQNRGAPNIALKGMTVADAVKRLFPNDVINLNNTNGIIETYAFNEPYFVVRNILLPQATDVSHRPFVFWRGLNGVLNFKSIATLENQSPSAKLFFGGAEEDDIYDTLLSFLPFNEGLNDTLRSFSVEWRALDAGLTEVTGTGTVADGTSGVVPFMSKSAVFNMQDFTRQFNPDVGYNDLTEALKTNAMRAGYFIDKVLCSLPLHPLLIAGKTVQIEVSMQGSDNTVELSQMFSGKWLIEQSHHLWDGSSKRGTTELVLCRSSVKPRVDTILINDAFGT